MAERPKPRAQSSKRAETKASATAARRLERGLSAIYGRYLLRRLRAAALRKATRKHGVVLIADISRGRVPRIDGVVSRAQGEQGDKAADADLDRVEDHSAVSRVIGSGNSIARLPPAASRRRSSCRSRRNRFRSVSEAVTTKSASVTSTLLPSIGR